MKRSDHRAVDLGHVDAVVRITLDFLEGVDIGGVERRPGQLGMGVQIVVAIDPDDVLEIAKESFANDGGDGGGLRDQRRCSQPSSKRRMRPPVGGCSLQTS